MKKKLKKNRFFSYQWMSISNKIENWKYRWYTDRINIYPVNLVATVLIQILWTKLWISPFLLVSSTSTLIIINLRRKKRILIPVVDDKIKKDEMRRTHWFNGSFHSEFYSNNHVYPCFNVPWTQYRMSNIYLYIYFILCTVQQYICHLENGHEFYDSDSIVRRFDATQKEMLFRLIIHYTFHISNFTAFIRFFFTFQTFSFILYSCSADNHDSIK